MTQMAERESRGLRNRRNRAIVGSNGSSVDGVHWPLNPAFERAEREAASPAAAQDVTCACRRKRDRDL